MALHKSWLWITVGMIAGLALTSTLVLRTTGAVMTGNTSTQANSFATGGAQLSNDYAASAPFNTATDSNLVGGQTLTKCVVVTYVGTTAATGVRLYVSGVTGSLKDYLKVTVDVGSSTSTNGDCNGFVSSSTITTGTPTLGSIFTANYDYDHGLGSWTPTAGQKLTYRFSITVDNVQAAQNSTAAGVFTWEARA